VSARERQLRRLLALREAQERVCEAQLAMAQRAVAKTKGELQNASESRNASLAEAQERLSNGDRERWWVELSTGTILERVQEELRGVLEGRSEDAEKARRSLERSRRQSEPARLLHEATVQKERIEKDRQEQRMSDDRFAARAHWELRAQRSVRMHS
jgi:flagellar biosynthesis chaperone FliJ